MRSTLQHSFLFAACTLFLLLAGASVALAGKTNANTGSLHDFSLKDINGKTFSFSKLKGKVVLLVNVASNCGYTYQYKGLQKLYAAYKTKGLVVIGIPANNFGGQEPGTNAQIKSFCTGKFKVTFPMMAKLSVKGKDQHPLYRWLTNKQIHSKTGGEVTWNFNKFLVGKSGKVAARFGSGVEPFGKKLRNTLKKLL